MKFICKVRPYFSWSSICLKSQSLFQFVLNLLEKSEPISVCPQITWKVRAYFKLSLICMKKSKPIWICLQITWAYFELSSVCMKSQSLFQIVLSLHEKSELISNCPQFAWKVGACHLREISKLLQKEKKNQDLTLHANCLQWRQFAWIQFWEKNSLLLTEFTQRIIKVKK